MATSTWSSNSLHGSDAQFRLWGKEVSDKLQAMGGLVKTGDTGQIDWATVARPGVNTTAGYEVYYLNDSLHGTAPIYVKIGYGTGTAAARPRMTFWLGTATNGAGTLSGIGLGTETAFTTTATDGSASASASYLCVKEGFWGFVWKIGIHSSWLIIQRTCDADGTPNIKGSHIMYRNSTSAFTALCLRYESTATAYTASTAGMVGFIPNTITSSLLQNGNVQVFLHWGLFPDMRPLFGTVNYVASEITAASTFTCTTVGSTTKTFIAINLATYGNGHNATYNLAMLWE